MYVFCVGMYRSGSTWQYEVVSHLLERFRNGQRRGVLTVEQLDTLDFAPEATAWQSWKFHDGHRHCAAALASGRALAVYSYRDLRDVVFSLMHKFSASFEEIVDRRQLLHACLDNDHFWRSQPGVLCQRYERLVDDPVAAIEQLAGHLRIEVDRGTTAELAVEYSLAANRERTARLARRLCEAGFDLRDPSNTCRYDEHSLLHWNHIREGRSGGWRHEANPQQLARLAAICGSWLIAQGYATDLPWAAPPAAAA
jgi:hypothetical protein